MKTACTVCKWTPRPKVTALDLKSRYWEIMRLNLVKRSVKLRSPWRPLRVFSNSRGIHPSLPYAASLVPSLRGGRGVANSQAKPIQTSPEAVSWQVAPQFAVRAAVCVVNGLRCWWRSTGSPAVWRRVSRCLRAGGGCLAAERWGAEGWPSWEPFELQAAGGMCLVSRSLFSSCLRGEPGESS